MHGRLRDWAQRNPVKALLVLTVVLVAITVMWTVVALGPDSLLDQHCSSFQRRCVKSHTSAAFWAVFSGIFAVIFGVMTLRRFLRSRADQASNSARDRAT